MPTIFLSPATQEDRAYATGGNEQYYMNLIADEMEPYLAAAGINFTRNNPRLTVGGAVRLSNAGHYDIHLALHSNAAPEALSGRIQGVDVYYYLGSPEGERLAELIARNFESVYPYPELVGTTPTTSIYELREAKAPAVQIEIAYHDNAEDAEWIKNNIRSIARALVSPLTEYLGLPFVEPLSLAAAYGTISADGFSVNIRHEPDWSSYKKGAAPNGARVMIKGAAGSWYNIEYNGMSGYVYGSYIKLE